jgi:hypothetical protein
MNCLIRRKLLIEKESTSHLRASWGVYAPDDGQHLGNYCFQLHLISVPHSLHCNKELCNINYSIFSLRQHTRTLMAASVKHDVGIRTYMRWSKNEHTNNKQLWEVATLCRTLAEASSLCLEDDNPDSGSHFFFKFSVPAANAMRLSFHILSNEFIIHKPF